MADYTPLIVAISVILGAAIFGLIASWDIIFDNGTAANNIEDNISNESNRVYNNPVPYGMNSSVPFYSGDKRIYLEERVSGSKYTQLEDNRTIMSD